MRERKQKLKNSFFKAFALLRQAPFKFIWVIKIFLDIRNFYDILDFDVFSSKSIFNSGGKEKELKKMFLFGLLATLLGLPLLGCGNAYENGEVYVYNWGEYIDPDTIEMFEKDCKIKVIYDEFETNEMMYPKVEAGAVNYDVVCPSDYMIKKMIDNDMLAEINWENIPNSKNIGAQYYETSKEFDPENKYSVPYCWGTVGILYNKTMVDEPITKWAQLWDPKYKNQILMQNSVRDAFMVALKLNGFSMNTTNIDELQIAKQSLLEQKPLVQAYVVDQVRDKMIGNEAAIGVIYSGEAIYTQRENENLEYVIPEEGTNVWIDSWVILKNAKNKENAEKFIDYMCKPEIALMNFDFITYSTPNDAARELIEDEDIRNSEIAFPDLSEYDNLETFKYLGEDGDELYNSLWKEVKSE